MNLIQEIRQFLNTDIGIILAFATLLFSIYDSIKRFKNGIVHIHKRTLNDSKYLVKVMVIYIIVLEVIIPTFIIVFTWGNEHTFFFWVVRVLAVYLILSFFAITRLVLKIRREVKKEFLEKHKNEFIKEKK